MKKHKQIGHQLRGEVRIALANLMFMNNLMNNICVHDDIVELIELEIDEPISDCCWFQLAINVRDELHGWLHD